MRPCAQGFAGRLLAALTALALIGGGVGCIDLAPDPDDALRLYVLTAESNFAVDLPNRQAQLVIDLPIASEGLNTTRIAVRESAISISYYAGVRWVEPAPNMVQALLVESFENTGKIVSVARRGTDLRADYSLKTELREFYADIKNPGEAPLVRVRLNAKLITMPQRIIIASETAAYTARAEGPSLRQVVEAFDEALHQALRPIIEWTLREMD